MLSHLAGHTTATRLQYIPLMNPHPVPKMAKVEMRYDATEFTQGATEVLAYGTAVKLTPVGR